MRGEHFLWTKNSEKSRIMETYQKQKATHSKRTRQVGKTYTALTIGKKYYKNTAYFNMEDPNEITNIFEKDFNIERIIRELSVRCRESIFKDDTLIIFDEIQASERDF